MESGIARPSTEQQQMGQAQGKGDPRSRQKNLWVWRRAVWPVGRRGPRSGAGHFIESGSKHPTCGCGPLPTDYLDSPHLHLTFIALCENMRDIERRHKPPTHRLNMLPDHVSGKPAGRVLILCYGPGVSPW